MVLQTIFQDAEGLSQNGTGAAVRVRVYVDCSQLERLIVPPEFGSKTSNSRTTYRMSSKKISLPCNMAMMDSSTPVSTLRTSLVQTQTCMP